MEHKAQLQLECPRCHMVHLMELHMEEPSKVYPAAAEIEKHMREWLATRCPDHLLKVLRQSVN